MTYYAHALINDPRTGQRYQQGDEVPEELPGFDELVEGGAVSTEPYDPAADVLPPPATVEIEGVRYIKVEDNTEAEDVRA